MTTSEHRTPLARASVHGRRLVTRARSAGSLAILPVPTTPTSARLRRQRDEARAAVRALRLWRDVVSRRLGVLAPVEDEPAHRREAIDRLRLLDAEATLARRIRTGGRLDDALVDEVRALLRVDEHVKARSFGQSLLRDPSTRPAGLVGIAMVARFQKLTDLAADRFDEVPVAVALRLAPLEYLDIAFRRDPDGAAALALEHWADLEPATRMAVVRFCFAAGRSATGLDLAERLREDGTGSLLRDRDRDDHGWLLEWRRRRDEERAAADAAAPAGVTVAVLDYKQPDLVRQSSNLGDYIQTLGALGHLLAFPVALTGDPGLVHVLEDLRERLRPELRHDAAPTTDPVRVVVANRDATHADAVPEGTWLVAFGWYMHSTFDGPYAFPLDRRINPIYVSFHVQRRAMLTPEAVAHLKEHGPVGCRDWTTTYLLLGLGVDAFFSGCLTTTVDAFVAPPDFSTVPAARAYVDAPIGADDTDAHMLTHAEAEVSRAPLDANLRRALAAIHRYRGFDSVVTSRLHCYLPATAVGCTVDFVPARLSDVRFDGLLGLSPGHPELERIQAGLRDKLSAVYREILAGADRTTVYARWRELTGADVTAARERLEAPARPLRTGIDVRAAVATILAARRDENPTPATDHPDTVRVALAADRNLLAEVPVVVESIVSTTNRPVHVTLLSRGYTRSDQSLLAELFPDTRFTFLPCDRVDYGAIAGMLRHITVSTMDRLLLPLLLADLDRVVYHDIDAVTLCDIGELYDTDLGGQPVAARSARASWAESGFANVYRAAARLPHDEAFEMRRRMFRDLPYDFVAFNAGIMVLDLDRMRRDDFCERFVPYVENYGMNDQEVLNCYAGPRRAVLDPVWNAVPQQETVTEPRIIHWAGPAKPWSEDYVILQEVWDRLVDQVREHAARQGVDPPVRSTP